MKSSLLSSGKWNGECGSSSTSWFLAVACAGVGAGGIPWFPVVGAGLGAGVGVGGTGAGVGAGAGGGLGGGAPSAGVVPLVLERGRVLGLGMYGKARGPPG